MRLTRVKRPLEENSPLVAIGPASKRNLPAMTVEEHFVDAYRRLHGPALNLAERYVGDDDAQDVVGDVWLAVWIRWSALKPKDRNDKYIFASVRHAVYKKLRQNRRMVSIEDAELDLDQQVMSAFHVDTRGDPKAEVLDTALLVMPHRRREVLLLAQEQGFSYPEVAEMLGVTVGTINTHMKLAMDDLRAAFTRAGYQIAEPQSRKKQKQLPAPKGDHTND